MSKRRERIYTDTPLIDEIVHQVKGMILDGIVLKDTDVSLANETAYSLKMADRYADISKTEEIVYILNFVFVKPFRQLGLGFLLYSLIHAVPYFLQYVYDNGEIIGESCYRNGVGYDIEWTNKVTQGTYDDSLVGSRHLVALQCVI